MLRTTCTLAAAAAALVAAASSPPSPPPPPPPPPLPFSGGVARLRVNGSAETEVFRYALSAGSVSGVVSSWWLAGPSDRVTLNFYVDGEAAPSVSLLVYEACGAGFGAPTGNVEVFSSARFSKGAKVSGWSSKVPVLFASSVRVTFVSAEPVGNFIWLWVRGSENLPVVLAPGLALPPTARLAVQRTSGLFQPLDFVDLVSVPAATAGAVLATMLTVETSSVGTFEGCVYLFPRASATWQSGMQLFATGTEDLFESAYFFDSGTFANLYAGALTVDRNGTDGNYRASAYKIFGDADPLPFSDGMRLVWRVGDASGPAPGPVPGAGKCTCPPGSTGCFPAGKPAAANVTALSFVYTW